MEKNKFEKIRKRIPRRWLEIRKKKMQQYLAESDEKLEERLQSEILREMKAFVIFVVLLLVCIVGALSVHVIEKETAEIQRNEAGEGDSTEEVTIHVAGETFEYEIPISEKDYTKKEREELFDSGFQYLEQEMLKNNKSKNEIRSNLNLLWEIPDSPLEVKWESEDESIVDLEGNVHNKTMKSGSKVVHIKLSLIYDEREQENVYGLTIYPRNVSENQEKAESILEEVKTIEKENRTKSSFTVPLIYNNGKIEFSEEANRWLILAGMILLVGVLLSARQWEQENRKSRDVKKASELEYSNILWQFVLLLEAGFTISMAWKKIVSDYENRKSSVSQDRRYVYEQMSYSCHQMELGYPLEQVFQLFSRKMAIRSYSRLMTLFLQNTTKGSKKMLEILKTEEHQAFVRRCEQAKRLGEEADTKLLLPMGMMLLNVLLILMVPAYLQF